MFPEVLTKKLILVDLDNTLPSALLSHKSSSIFSNVLIDAYGSIFRIVTVEQKSFLIDFFTEGEVISVLVVSFVVVGFDVVVVLVSVGVEEELELLEVAHLKLKSESRRHSVK